LRRIWPVAVVLGALACVGLLAVWIIPGWDEKTRDLVEALSWLAAILVAVGSALLWAWRRTHNPPQAPAPDARPADTGPPGPVSNSISGRVTGSAVQAGSITGGVHFSIPSGDVTSQGPAFELRHRQGFRYLLVNIGSATATEVVMDLGDHGEGLTRDVPRGITLPPGRAHSVLLGGSAQAPPPAQVWVSCAELVEPVSLVVPPYR
jgi:hypothetical protein